jgi:hypothetical protein
MYIRTLDFVQWDKYLECNISTITFTLDFEMNAGFSLCQAISNRMIQKGSTIVEVDKAREKAMIQLKLDYELRDLGIKIKELEISDISNNSYETTDRYLISTTFSLINLNNKNLNEIFKKFNSIKESVEEEIIFKIFFSGFFGAKAEELMNEIISFIEYSGFYARQVPSTLNLYLTDEKGKNFRITQRGGGEQSSSQNPIHPLLIKRKSIISNYENYLLTPKNIKKHYKKGVHYQFLGFYDESFLCFYKIIESIFKDDSFSKLLSEVIFKTNSKELSGAIKSSNQKTMMLYIYQYFIEVNKEPIDDEKKAEILKKMISASDIRNNIAHSSDQSEESKKVLPFLINLARFMIATKNSTP